MIRAVLFDRDGTLIADDGSRSLMHGAVAALARLRAFGMRIGVVTNQPRAGRDVAFRREMKVLHDRIEARVGKLDGWFICAHAPRDACECRKPRPGLVLQALRGFGIAAHECVVIGDIGSDVQAALSAGAHAILVPTPVTLPEEIVSAPIVCRDLLEAADRVLGELAA